MSDQVAPDRQPVVLTADGRTWLEQRRARAIERQRRVEEELATERTEELVSERQQLIDQIHELDGLLRDAVAPSDVIDDPSVVELGDEVEIRFSDGSLETFLIVHPVEAAMDEHRTSCEAPVARAVLGHRPGDEVSVTTPSGTYHCTILRRERIG